MPSNRISHQSKADSFFNLPNRVTFSRLMLIPLMVIAFYLPWDWSRWTAAFFFLVGGSTDWLDGYLARKLDMTTNFGAFLDPVADKLLVTVALLLLVEAQASVSVAIAAILIISREITISALREWMAQQGQQAKVAVAYVGKVKTVVQIAAITLMMGVPVSPPPVLAWLTHGLLWGAVVMTLYSMGLYLKSAWRVLTHNSKLNS